MMRIREFIRSGGAAADDELNRILRDQMSGIPAADRPAWRQQVELALDGYGGDVYRNAASRVRAALDDIESTMPR